jgi:2-polyprenyl-3-methyl-5-hydroxy-6-metoxy-1,4-benzoquinol methylase
MRDYRHEFYRVYASTHTVPRKGVLTPERLQARTSQWRLQFGPLLPARKDARILDAGCGDGVLLWWLQASGYTLAEGVEVSAEQVEAARAVGVRNVHQSDLLEFLRSRAGAYDAIVMRNVLEHFEKPDVLEIVQAVHGALASGGAFVLQVPNAESPFFGRIRYGDFTHGLAFSSTSLAQVLAVYGFVGHGFHPVRPLFGGWRGWPRRVLWRAVEAFYRGLLTAELGPGRYIVTQDIISTAVKP